MRTSVIVCTFNRIDWLPKCLESLLAQDPRPDEIIVVDGPSVDGTREMLEEKEREGVLKLIRQRRLDGISAARNLGLAASTGDIVCFIDDDAIAQPGWLKAIMGGYVDETVGGVGGPVHHMDGRLCMGRNAVSTEGLWFDESRNESLDGCYPSWWDATCPSAASPSTPALRSYFKYHQDETDACLGVSVWDTVYDMRRAVVHHEWCEVIGGACCVVHPPAIPVGKEQLIPCEEAFRRNRAVRPLLQQPRFGLHLPTAAGTESGGRWGPTPAPPYWHISAYCPRRAASCKDGGTAA